MSKWALALGVVALALTGGAAVARQGGEPAAASQPAPEDRLPLMVGDRAPGLLVERWIKGEPVTAFEQGKVYVVECWATWCGPCKRSIPHLTKIQKEFKDRGLTVVGVSIWEGNRRDKPDKDGQLRIVADFVADRGEEMGYTVAFGDSKGMSAAWMQAAAQNGIPAAFVINRQGRVAWIGNPLDARFEAAVRAVVEGTHDLEAEAAAYAQRMRPVIEQRRREGGLTAAIEARDWARAVEAVRAGVERDRSAGLRSFQDAYYGLIHTQRDYDAAYALAARAAESVFRNDAEALNFVAWIIVDPQNPAGRPDLDLALRAAERAVELAPEDPAILDTLATVHVARGDLGRALPIQEKAARLSVGTQFEEEIRARLEEIREALRSKGG